MEYKDKGDQIMESIGKIVMIPKGNYSASVTYKRLDLVRYQGKAWVCKQDDVIGVTPVEGTTWTMVVQDGEPGAAPSVSDETLIFT